MGQQSADAAACWGRTLGRMSDSQKAPGGNAWVGKEQRPQGALASPDQIVILRMRPDPEPQEAVVNRAVFLADAGRIIPADAFEME